MSQQILLWVEHTWISTAIRRSSWAVMAFEAVHLLGLALLGGAACIIAFAALRRGGLRGISLATVVRGLRPLIVGGLLLMAVSGTLIVLSMPFKYYLNTAFRLKMALLAAAIVATAALSRSADTAAAEGRRRRLALLAWVLWFGVGFSGRLIGFL